MRILIVKMTSMGDVIHAFPAITELKHHYPQAKIDWVVEETFAEMLGWHSGVDRVIPVAIRKWRKALYRSKGEIKKAICELRLVSYDMVLDLQGLLKSALLTRLAKSTRRVGLHDSLLREKEARFFYTEQHNAISTHIVHQTKRVVASALGYTAKETVDFGLQLTPSPYTDHPYVMCLHSTTWLTKHWPIYHWHALIDDLNKLNVKVLLPWCTESEKDRADALAIASNVIVLPKSSLTDIVQWAMAAQYCVSVDTGLGHIVAATGVPTSMLFGPTNAQRLGVLRSNQFNVVSDIPCAPCGTRKCNNIDDSGSPSCYQQVTPKKVLQDARQYLPQSTEAHS